MASIPKAAKSLLPPIVHSQKVGVVVSAGRMKGAVRVRVAEQEWNKKFRKHFPTPTTYLASDPNSSLVPGDIVRISSGNRTSKSISHTVTSILAPFGAPVEARPPVLSQAELDAKRLHDRLLKDVRSAERGRQTSISRLREARKMGLEIPSLEEAREKGRMWEEEFGGKAVEDKGRGAQNTKRARREAKKVKEEAKEVKKAKSGRRRSMDGEAV